jgi:hypothetical protein
VQLVNISGVARKAATVGEQLASLGYQVSSSTTGQVPAAVTETVVRYHPGSLNQALTVMHSLSGAVIMHSDPNVSDGHVAIDLGSTAAVVTPPTDTTSTTVASGKTSTSNTTIPTAGNQPPSASVDQPQPYDPTACAPAGVSGQP